MNIDAKERLLKQDKELVNAGLDGIAWLAWTSPFAEVLAELDIAAEYHIGTDCLRLIDGTLARAYAEVWERVRPQPATGKLTDEQRTELQFVWLPIEEAWA